ATVRSAACQRAREAPLMETFGVSRCSRKYNCPPSAKRRQRGIARWRRPVNGFVASSYTIAELLAAQTTRAANPWPNAFHSVLLDRGRRWRTELAAVEHGVVALLAFLEAYRSGEHVSSAPGLLELVHPPIRDLTGLTGILRAGSVGSVDERNALHLVAIILRIRPRDADSECRPLVIQGKGLRHILRVAAVREGGHVFRPAGADHDRRAIAPVDGAGQGAPMRPAAGLDRDRRPSRRSLKRYALAADAVVGGASILRARRRRDREGEQSRRQKISQRVHSQLCNRD